MGKEHYFFKNIVLNHICILWITTNNMNSLDYIGADFAIWSFANDIVWYLLIVNSCYVTNVINIYCNTVIIKT